MSLGFLQSRSFADEYYVVKRGDSLSQIAKRKLGSPVWHREGTLNKILNFNPVIKDQDLIYPGQRIRINNNGEVIFDSDPRFYEPLKPAEKPPAPMPVANTPALPQPAKAAAPAPVAKAPAPLPKKQKVWDYNFIKGKIAVFIEPNYLRLNQTLVDNGSKFRGYGWLAKDIRLLATRDLPHNILIKGDLTYQDSHNLASSGTNFDISHHSSGKVGADVAVGYRLDVHANFKLIPYGGIAVRPTEVFHFLTNTNLELDQLGIFMAQAGLTMAIPTFYLIPPVAAHDVTTLTVEYGRHLPSKSNYDFSQGPIQQVEVRLMYDHPFHASPASLYFGLFERSSWAQFSENNDNWKFREIIVGLVFGIGMNFFNDTHIAATPASNSAVATLVR